MTYIEFDFEPPIKPKTNNADDGYCCPHCKRLVKRYRRKLNSNMVMTLMYLYKAGAKDWVHVEKWLAENNHPRSGDFHKLIHWNLLEKMYVDREDGSPRNGYYKLNGRSILFIEGKLEVPEKVVMLNGSFEGFEGKHVNIKDCLPSKFNYQELMDEQPSPLKDNSL